MPSTLACACYPTTPSKGLRCLNPTANANRSETLSLHSPVTSSALTNIGFGCNSVTLGSENSRKSPFQCNNSAKSVYERASVFTCPGLQKHRHAHSMPTGQFRVALLLTNANFSHTAWLIHAWKSVTVTDFRRAHSLSNFFNVFISVSINIFFGCPNFQSQEFFLFS